MPGRVVIMLAALVVPVGLRAQGGASVGSANSSAMPYGGGQQASLSYAGQEAPSNVLLLSAGSETSYDSNVLGGRGPAAVGDSLFALGPHVSVLHQGLRFGVEVDYQPYFQFYQRMTQYDRVNQALSVDTKLALSSHWALRLRDSFMSQTGLYQPLLGSSFVDNLGFPTRLNTSVYVPSALQRDNDARFDVTYQRSASASVSFFGGYGQLDFLGQPLSGQQLLNTKSETAGGEYTYRLSEHVTLGALTLLQRFSSSGSSPQGSPSGVIAASILASLAWHLRPTVAANAFFGPQYSRPDGLPGVGSSLVQSNANQLSWAAGGTISKQAGQTAVFVSAYRMVTDGGGLVAYVRNSALDVGLRRRLVRHWDVTWDVAVAQNKVLDFGLGSSSIPSQSISFGLQHPIGDRLTARLNYSLMRQNGSGLLPSVADFNRNLITLGIFYQVRRIPLGR